MPRSHAAPTPRFALSRSACIDIGSNTTRLLVAELVAGRLREVLAERTFTRLGAGRSADGGVDPEAIRDIGATAARQAALARELGCERVRVVATAAVRTAHNRADVEAAVRHAAGLRLEILSEDDEARMAFAGVVGTLPDAPAGLLGVIDVGGGSTELVVGTARDGVRWSTSLPLGSASVTGDLLVSDPPTPAELAGARTVLGRLFAKADADGDMPVPAVSYAVGGSATSLRRLVGSVLDRAALARGLQALTSRRAQEIALRLGLHAERARLLPASILLLDAGSRALRAPLRMAGGGLREGIVLEDLGGAAFTR